MIWHFILLVTGTHIPNGQYSNFYNFWSGFAGDIPLFGGVFMLYRRFNCHVEGCKRIGLHHVQGTPYVTCKTHHPTASKQKITHQHILDLHRKGVNR